MSEPIRCHQCCISNLCKHIDRGTRTLASPACKDFDLGLRWIPVTERMPEDGVWVLCLRPPLLYEVLRLNSGKGQWESRRPYMNYMIGFVKYWMPLPDAPGEE